MYWKVVGSNTRIVGSMHLVPAESHGLPTWARDAFEWAESLVLEHSGDNFQSHFAATQPSRLSMVVTNAAWAAIKALWSNAPGAPSPDSLKPWAVFLLTVVLSQRTEKGIEPSFTDWACQQSKPLEFLETSEDLAAIFDALEYEEVCKAIEDLALDLSAPQRAMENMYAAWFRGDVAGMGIEVLKSPLYSFPGIKAQLLDRRNRNWTPRLLELLESPARTLVVVGAAHLFGQSNILDLIDHRVELLL